MDEYKHEHHHHDECCGHDHHHEHHHEHHHHDECCGHEHGEHENKEYGKPVISISHHDGAVVVSGKMYKLGSAEKIKAALEEKMKEAALVLNDNGAIIGHIKASFETRSIEVLSVTESDVTKNKAPEDETTITVAAILFVIEDGLAEETIKNMMAGI